MTKEKCKGEHLARQSDQAVHVRWDNITGHCGLSAQGCGATLMCGQGDAHSMLTSGYEAWLLADIVIGADMHEGDVHARKA